ALAYVDYHSGEENQKRMFLVASQAPVMTKIYDDPEVQEKYDFATQLRDAISQAKSRPVSPVYPQVSQAIYKNVNEALAGRVSPQDALAQAEEEMNQALATF
ncbi:MAG: ABC transporter substrate-binding protein, partial [Actinomycetota bacterium]|nr:ABC transporter substrate-binding protein [Actinomycetota bacterium]